MYQTTVLQELEEIVLFFMVIDNVTNPPKPAMRKFVSIMFCVMSVALACQNVYYIIQRYSYTGLDLI